MFLMCADAIHSTNSDDRLEGAALDEAVRSLKATIVAMTASQLEELARMRAVGMQCVRQLDRRAHGRLDLLEEALFARGSRGVINDFVKVARAVRQIILLEQELAGLRPARRGGQNSKAGAKAPPDLRGMAAVKALDGAFPKALGDDLLEYYDHRPVGEAVAWIRGTLGIAAPADDPFRTRAEAQAEVAVAEAGNCEVSSVVVVEAVLPSPGPAGRPLPSRERRFSEALPLDGGGLGEGDGADVADGLDLDLLPRHRGARGPP